jgi:hypothetical protein
MKKDLLRIIQLHLTELNTVKLIYKQFNDLIQGSLRERVCTFISTTNKAHEKIEEFKNFVKEIH